MRILHNFQVFDFHVNYMVYWQIYFDNDILVDCLFSEDLIEIYGWQFVNEFNHPMMFYEWGEAIWFFLGTQGGRGGGKSTKYIVAANYLKHSTIFCGFK